jgi:hypothetical protein
MIRADSAQQPTDSIELNIQNLSQRFVQLDSDNRAASVTICSQYVQTVPANACIRSHAHARPCNEDKQRDYTELYIISVILTGNIGISRALAYLQRDLVVR